MRMMGGSDKNADLNAFGFSLLPVHLWSIHFRVIRMEGCAEGFDASGRFFKSFASGQCTLWGPIAL